jgi:hypothetical protein
MLLPAAPGMRRCLRHALFLSDNDRDALIAGSIEEHLAAI